MPWGATMTNLFLLLAGIKAKPARVLPFSPEKPPVDGMAVFRAIVKLKSL